ncbi:MAG: TonB-dependent receptor [Terracidiphilus sp.]|jgi:hypothetical protein
MHRVARKSSCALSSFFLLMLLLVCVLGRAQLTESTLKGNVADASGSVQHAAIVVTNENTGISRATTGNDDGSFTVPDLPPGLYNLKVKVQGYKAFEQRGVELNVGKTSEVNVHLEIGQVDQTVEVSAQQATVPVSTDGRLSDTLEKNQITGLPIPGRDVFFLTSLSAGATSIPGASTSGKLTNSPAVAVNGNRFRGDNYVLDGALDAYLLEEGTPSIVPSLDSIEEVQVQTDNFSSEYGRGNGSVVNIRTRSGTNTFHGRLWEYQKNAALNAVNRFSITGEPAPLVFNQFGGNLGGPVFKKRTFFFGSYEGTRDAFGTPFSYQVETPEFRSYVAQKYPSGIAEQLLSKFPAPTPVRVGAGYLGEVDLNGIPAAGTAEVNVPDNLRDDQYVTRIDHTFNQQKDTLFGRWIAEYDRDSGTSAVSGKSLRGFGDPTHFFYGNFNSGETHVFERQMVNDVRFSFNNVTFSFDRPYEQYPTINITGITAGFGDAASLGSHLRTFEARDSLSINHRDHLLRAGFEWRKQFVGFNLGQPSAGSFYFNGLSTFAADQPYEQTLIVTPATGEPAEQERDFSFYEYGIFAQDDWKVTHRLTLTLGVRNDYFGDPSERRGELTSILFGTGSTVDEQLANATVGHVGHLFHGSPLNFSPRVGLAYDPFGDGKSTIRAGFSLAYEPIHGHTVMGGTANPPYAIQGVIWPANGYGTAIDYGIPVPFNPEFKTTLNAQGGVVAPAGEPPIRISPWLIDPKLKTQHSASYFLSVQREVAKSWIVELGYVGTDGMDLERRDDINRFEGDLLVNNGQAKRINQNLAGVTYVMSDVSSNYNAFTAEVRHQVATGFTLQANYRWSKWLDTSSDTNTGSFLDNADGSEGAEDADCLKCERGLSEMDIPRRFTASAVWVPQFSNRNGFVASLYKNWQISTIISAQSGRPFSPYCSAPSKLVHEASGALVDLGCDYNMDGGGGIGSGFYDRPDAPMHGAVKSSFKQKDFINGLYSPTVFPQPVLGTDGTLSRDFYRGPRQTTTDLALGRNFSIGENRIFQFRADAFNAFNNVNLYLPNNDLALALQSNGAYSSTSIFGKSTKAFDPRVFQLSAKIVF